MSNPNPFPICPDKTNWAILTKSAETPLFNAYHKRPDAPEFSLIKGAKPTKLAVSLSIESSLIQNQNKLILNLLEQGVASLVLHFNQIPSVKELEMLFEGIHLDMISIHLRFKSFDDWTNAVKHFKKWWSQKSLSRDKSHQISITFPIQTFDNYLDMWSFIIHDELLEISQEIRLFSVELLSNSSIELGKALFQINNIFFWGQEKGLSIDDMSSCILFECQASTYLVDHIAFLKALRILFYELVHAYHPIKEAGQEAYIMAHAVNKYKSGDNTTQNILHQTVQSTAVILAGGNEWVSYPFDQDNINFGTRISTNIYHLLTEESYLTKKIDLTAGSYSIEVLLKQYLSEAWNYFTEAVE